MRTRNRRAAAVTIAAGIVLGMTACVGSDPLPTLPPSPSGTPIFGSEEEALAAAEDAYAAYLEMSSLIASEGGEAPERIAPFVTERQLDAELATAAYYSDNGLRAVGNPTLVSVQLQQYYDDAGAAEVSVYVCVDVTQTRVLDSAGQDVTPARPDVGALEVSLVASAAENLRVDSSELWADSSFC